MIYPLGDGTKKDFFKRYYSADGFGSNRGSYLHNGVDLNLRTGGDTDLGEKLNAIASGVITYYHEFSHPKAGYGRHSVLKIEGVWGTRYAHYAHQMSDGFISKVQPLKEGDQVGKMGKSGLSPSSHLHFAIFKVDPATLPKGIDTIAKTKKQLNDWWEDPLPFLNKYYGGGMPNDGNISIPKATFERLVTNSSRWDEVKKLGYGSAAEIKSDVDSYKKDLSNCREQTRIEKDRADLFRDDFNGLLSTVAKALNTTQEISQVEARLAELENTLDDFSDLQRQFAELQVESGAKEEELNAEIDRLKAVIKHGDISDFTFEELLAEFVKRIKQIIRR